MDSKRLAAIARRLKKSPAIRAPVISAAFDLFPPSLRFGDLFRRYGIVASDDAVSLRFLVEAMARKREPGWRAKRGRPQKTVFGELTQGQRRDLLLFCLIEQNRLGRTRRCKVSDVLRDIADGKVLQPLQGGANRQRYYRGKVLSDRENRDKSEAHKRKLIEIRGAFLTDSLDIFAATQPTRKPRKPLSK